MGNTGGFVGIVRDASGAAIPGAAIDVRNVETNSLRRGSTDVEGGFSIPNLPPGMYEVMVEKPGFQRWRRAGTRPNSGGWPVV